MKTIADERLTLNYLQKLSRENYFATAGSVIIITVSFLWMLFRIGGDNGTVLYGDILYAVADWIGALSACTIAYRARYGPVRLAPQHQLAWLLIGVGLFLNGLGGAIFAYLEQIGFPNPTPSYSDIGFTLFYLLAFVGLILMPTELTSRRLRIRTALDALITTLCLLGVSWFFFISQVFAEQVHQKASTATLIMVISYPCWDMLLILAIALLIWRRAERILYPSLFLCGAGVLSWIWADTGYAYFTALGTYTSGTFYIDTFWFIGGLLIGLSALYQYSAIAHRVYNERAHPIQMAERAAHAMLNRSKAPGDRALLLQSTLIYLPLTILLVLTLGSEFMQDEERGFFLVVLTAIVGILVTIRYLFATQENEGLLREREQQREDAERLRLLTTQLNEVLELNSLFELIVTLATSELGYDSTLLLLVEEYDRPFPSHSNLSVYATASPSFEIRRWGFQGDHLPQSVAVLTKEVEIVWMEENLPLPPIIRAWQEERQIERTLFIPLAYQGKLLGSLGFSRRAGGRDKLGPYRSHRDSHVARAYAEQAATAIKHARLYQDARDHELFANALATIAARLNAAFAEPTEIHQLICQESANALQADYALLYVPDNGGQLIPVAMFTSSQEPSTMLSDWSPIRQQEAAASALQSLQPVLMQLDDLPTRNTSHSQPAIPVVHQADTRSTGKQRVTGAQLVPRRPTSVLEMLARRFVHTAILAPLITRMDPVGLLILGRSLRPGAHDKRSFIARDLSQAQDFAEQAAVALTNANLYQQLRSAHQRQQELDKLKDQFMITASHELRTPLTAIQGYLELMAQFGDTLPAEQRQEFVQKAQRGCDELVLLLHNVMDASRLEIDAGIRPAHMEHVPVREAVQSVVDLIEPQLAHEHRELHLSISDHLAVQADPARLRQVLLNLSVNALKYSPPDSPLTFAARPVKDHVPSIVISVIDKGKGIAPQDQDRLFERFFRLERDMNSPIRGSGLGLYISRRLIEAMGGKIWVESEGIPGEGSIFQVQLPMAY
jgi:signal transduction histidine kinase